MAAKLFLKIPPRILQMIEQNQNLPMKANCYECKYRGEIPGDAHSCCNHPLLGKKDDNPFGAMAQMLTGRFRAAAQKLNVKAHPQGVRSGWFMWPANFDPVWLQNCDGFESKTEAKQIEQTKTQGGECQ